MNVFRFFRAHFSKDRKLYLSIKNILGFYPGNIFLYKLALLHRSASQTSNGNIRLNNERLEYLGDTVLSTIIADMLFKIYSSKPEGFLTEMRSKSVSRSSLNKLSKKLGIAELIRKDSRSSAIFRSMDGDALEALIGAIYLDKGYNFTKHIIIRKIINIHLDLNELENSDWNYKSKLLDWGQREKHSVAFETLSTEGNGYKKVYLVQVLVDGKAMQKGQGYTIKSAEQTAAENTYKAIFAEKSDNL